MRRGSVLGKFAGMACSSSPLRSSHRGFNCAIVRLDMHASPTISYSIYISQPPTYSPPRKHSSHIPSLYKCPRPNIHCRLPPLLHWQPRVHHPPIPTPTRHQIDPKQRIPLHRRKCRPAFMLPPPLPTRQRHVRKVRFPTRAIRL